ncbi:hypothetical protein JOE59_002633 [Agromyces cerinus]|uniref:hypothetical protein n=1 Tax=Agromyces cerinus TaxID=33878 RepID=UPI00195EDE9E|nr:hypothetical protein [Agromyces cerinus]MBM7831928.1 hypothetical protein [Agromyces cerinus]
MTTNSSNSDTPTTAADAAVTAILSDSSTPPTDEAAGSTTTGGDANVAADSSPMAAARPTIRWGALVWALLFGAMAATTLWVLIDPARRDAVGVWLTTLSPLTAGLYAIIVVGIVVALFGIVGLIRRGERARR